MAFNFSTFGAILREGGVTPSDPYQTGRNTPPEPGVIAPLSPLPPDQLTPREAFALTNEPVSDTSMPETNKLWLYGGAALVLFFLLK